MLNFCLSSWPDHPILKPFLILFETVRYAVQTRFAYSPSLIFIRIRFSLQFLHLQHRENDDGKWKKKWKKMILFKKCHLFILFTYLTRIRLPCKRWWQLFMISANIRSFCVIRQAIPSIMLIRWTICISHLAILSRCSDLRVIRENEETRTFMLYFRLYLSWITVHVVCSGKQVFSPFQTVFSLT